MKSKQKTASTFSRLGFAAASLCLISLLSTPAQGQYALDGNLMFGSRGINPVADSERNIFLFRNAILTGNVPERSFRGSLGYTAPADFRGSLGSDDLFRFARDSYQSGLALQGIRSLGGMHGVLAETDPNSFARFSLARSSAGATLDEVRARMGQRLTVPLGGAPAFSTLDGSEFVRSLAARSTDASLRGSVLGYGGPQEGMLVEVAASGLRGLYEIPLVMPPSAGGRVAGDPTGQVVPEPGLLAERERVNPLRRGERVDARAPTRLPGPGEDPYTDLLDRFAIAHRETVERADDSPELYAGLGDDRMQRLLTFEEQYRQMTEQLQKRAEKGEPDETGELPQSPWSAITSETDDGEDGEDGEARRELPAMDLESLLEHYLPRHVREQAPLTDLAGSAETLFAEQMRRGQDLLSEGRYFDAEAHFSAALAARPSQPLAQVGKLNAQLGAGLFLSAGATVRGLLVTHPEVLAITYDERVLPPTTRTKEIIALLEERTQRQATFAPTAAVLLAYLGHVTRESDLVRSSIESLEALGDPDELVPLLRALWLSPPEAGKRGSETP